MREVKRYKPVINNKPYRPYAYCEENSEGIYVRIDDYEAIKADRDALAAENVALKYAYSSVVDSFDDAMMEIGMLRGETSKDYPMPPTPATDVFINSVRAEAVQKLWKDSLSDVGHVLDEIGAYQDAPAAAGIVHDEIKERVEDFAKQLRAGKDKP